MRYQTKTMVAIGFLAALSTVLMWFQVPLLPAAPFLEYDLSDVPVLMGAFSLGPVAGCLISIVKAFVFLLTKGKSGIIGAFMNLVSTVSLVFVASYIYKKFKKSFTGSVIGYVLGTITMTMLMVLTNMYIALPIWGIPVEQIKPLVISAIIPFNLLRGLISCIITAVLYKRFKNIMDKFVSQ